MQGLIKAQISTCFEKVQSQYYAFLTRWFITTLAISPHADTVDSGRPDYVKKKRTANNTDSVLEEFN